MVQRPYICKTMVILDFKKEAKHLRKIIDRFSLPSAAILRPAVLYAFSNLYLKLTGSMLTTFYFAACDCADELLIPNIDSSSSWIYQLNEIEVEKQKREFFLLVQILGQLIEHHLRINAIPVPDRPEDVLSATLRGDSLYVVYNQRNSTTYEDHRNYPSRSA